MRWLIMYIRQVFCKHEFAEEEAEISYHSSFWDKNISGTRVSLTCGKCGFHNTYWKYGKAGK